MLRDRLENHLSNLKYRGLITTWYDREISAGEEWAQQIDIYLNNAHIILLLISASFMASEYCYSIEMRRALERHERQEADVIPILLRPVLYTDAPFAKLQMLPTNRKPVVQWRDRDSAFVDIAYGIERVALKYSPSIVGEVSAIEEAVRSQSLELEPLPQSPTGALSSGPLLPDSRPRRATGRRGFRQANKVVVPQATNSVVALIAAVLLACALLQHPTLNLLVGYILAIILGLLLLIVGIIAIRKAIGAIRARVEQRRAQEAREVARRRSYYEETIEAYRRALIRSPLDGDAFRGVGNALYALERYDEALNAFLQAIRYNPTPAAYAGLGNVFAKLKRYGEAVEAYEKAIEIDPTVTFNYDDLIPSLLAVGRKEEVKQVRARAKQLGYEDDS